MLLDVQKLQIKVRPTQLLDRPEYICGKRKTERSTCTQRIQGREVTT